MPNSLSKKTKDKLIYGLSKLLQEKKLAEITVHEITDLADLNRCTFYLHYENVNDMLAKIEEDIFRDFCMVFQNHPFEEHESNPLPMLADVYRFYGNHADMMKVMLSNNQNPDFLSKMESRIKNMASTLWNSQNEQQDASFEYCFTYISAGFGTLIRNWLDTGMHETPQEMAEITLNLMPSPFFRKV